MLRESQLRFRALDTASAPPRCRFPKQDRSGVEAAAASNAREFFAKPRLPPKACGRRGPVRAAAAVTSIVPAVKDEAVLSAIGSEVSRLAWRNRWMDADDLKQEAILTALSVDARGLWRSSEAPVRYMARAVRSRLLEMVVRSRCPVRVGIGSHRDGSCGWSAAYREASAMRSVDVDDGAAVEAPTPEDDLDRARALSELRRVLAEQTPAARAVILGEEKPADVAKAYGLTAAQVYWQTEKARDAVKARLLELVRQGCGRGVGGGAK